MKNNIKLKNMFYIYIRILLNDTEQQKCTGSDWYEPTTARTFGSNKQTAISMEKQPNKYATSTSMHDLVATET